MLKGRWGRQGKNTNRHREDTKEGEPSICQRKAGTALGLKKGPLPGMFMEGFQGKIGLHQIMGQEERERDSIEWEGLNRR